VKKLLLIVSLLSVSGVSAYVENQRQPVDKFRKETSIEAQSARTGAIAGAILGAVALGGSEIGKSALGCNAARIVVVGGFGALVGFWSGAIVGLGSLELMKFVKNFPVESVVGTSAAGAILYCLKK